MNRPPSRVYHVLATPVMIPMALRLVKDFPGRFIFHETDWSKFLDGTDNITLGGFKPTWTLRDEHVLFLASFHNNDVIVSQFHAFITLLNSFISTFTVCLPFYPYGTNERVTVEGRVATASTMATMFSCLPSCGKPSRLMIYDLHTLQNRFYLSQNCVASLCSAIPLLKRKLQQLPAAERIDGLCFPDDGAAKRFMVFFDETEEAMESGEPHYEKVICGKRRGEGGTRHIHIQEGEPEGRNILIIDDLIQTGGTVLECAMELKRHGAKRVAAYVTHAVFPAGSWKKFLKSESGAVDKFYVTNSNPNVVKELPTGDVFEVLDLLPQVVADL